MLLSSCFWMLFLFLFCLWPLASLDSSNQLWRSYTKQCQWGFPHRTLDLDPMRIGDPDSKTTSPPHGLDPDLNCMLCCVTVLRESAHSLRAMWSACDTTLNQDWGSESSESGFSSHVESPIVATIRWSCIEGKQQPLQQKWQDNTVAAGYPHRTLTATSVTVCSIFSGTAMYSWDLHSWYM